MARRNYLLSVYKKCTKLTGPHAVKFFYEKTNFFTAVSCVHFEWRILCVAFLPSFCCFSFGSSMAGSRWHLRNTQSSRFVAVDELVRRPKIPVLSQNEALKRFRSRQDTIEVEVEKAIQRARRTTKHRRGPLALKKLERLHSMKSVEHQGKRVKIIALRPCTTAIQTTCWVVIRIWPFR